MAPGVSGNGFGFADSASPGTVDSANPPASTFTSLNENLLFSVTGTTSGVTPEPTTLLLFGTGLLGVMGAARRKWLG
jgi:PEP-CTERM motif